VLERLKDDIDYISLHTYIGNRDHNFEKFLSASIQLDQRIEVVAGQIKAVQATMARPRPIFIAFDEWNVWYRARGSSEYETGRTGLEEQYNF
jgi:alpha-N-arabinofuranosidase